MKPDHRYDPYASPARLAQTLCQRHNDIGFIQAIVKREFGTAPSRERIAAMRADAVRAQEWRATIMDRYADRLEHRAKIRRRK